MPNPPFIEITNLDGTVIEARAEGVWRILQAVANEAGATHTTVDFDGGEQETDEPIARLLTALSAAKTVLVRLTTPARSAVYLNPTAVTGVRPAEPGIDAPGALCAITVGGHRQAVLESPAEAALALGLT